MASLPVRMVAYPNLWVVRQKSGRSGHMLCHVSSALCCKKHGDDLESLADQTQGSSLHSDRIFLPGGGQLVSPSIDIVTHAIIE